MPIRKYINECMLHREFGMPLRNLSGRFSGAIRNTRPDEKRMTPAAARTGGFVQDRVTHREIRALPERNPEISVFPAIHITAHYILR